MRMDRFFRVLGEAFGEAMAENGKFRFDRDGEPGGVPLSELDMADETPDSLKVALRRSDTVKVTAGETLSIEVEGDPEAREGLRFRLEDGTLRIYRPRGGAGGSTINVTMPAPRKIAVGGAGTIQASEIGPDATLAIGGSGLIRARKVAGGSLTAKIGGSGRIEAAGEVEELALSIGGSGKLDAKGLEVERANVRIGGSGKVEFSSDGEVDARIGGAGDIVVHGSPRCSIKAGGAGRLRCVPRQAPAAPEAA